MPYIGNKHRYDDKLVTVKLYGPEHRFDTTANDIEKMIESAISRSSTERSSLVEWVARNIAGEVEKDDNVLWVECEVMYSDGSLYGGVSELVG